MLKDPGDILLRRYLEGSCTQAEEAYVEAWLEEHPSHADRLEQFASRNADAVDVDEERIKGNVLRQIGNEVTGTEGNTGKVAGQTKYPPNRSHTKWMATAAVILLALSVSTGIYLWQNQFSKQKIVYVERTMPAGKTATLTLSDGTKVYLNSESTLKFPKEFGPTSREIYLKGEAFFEVASDEERPFKVHAGNLQTTVLGTSFNVKAFSGDQDVQVAVEHGKVSVGKEQADSADTMLLTRNQWATFDKASQKLTKKTGDIRRFTAWRKGVLYFHGKTVADIVATLERWYGTDIIIQNEGIKDCMMHGEHKEENLENVLKAMEFALDMSYEFAEEGIIITGGRCK